ncbi:glutathione S-transferase N-terminal domain-containing protein [Microvirga sp. ACRRW]|uniref:glutathione S-transferase family protein n=1 Tax=Microvirga sp. ACRRW TaxID=2918205 RepID=UPI001EF3EF24|nr:glutathione S-transferase N-terminal domain-containing protein [Microvirga sp. ACRRW]MCG7391483.1 glutathione S-transferase N-terminal domain-containing protein [Microvirga sp. ACRRW]
MLALYYYPGNASLLPHMMLREIGVPFEMRLVDRNQNAQKSAEYLKLNPNGRIPVLVDDEFVLFETVAIALYLADKFPEAGLAPALGTKERAEFNKWMVHLTNTPQAEYRAWFYPHEHVIDEAAAPAVKQGAEQRLYRMFDVISEQLGDKTWLLGDHFSAADLFLFMLIRWGRGMPRPPRTIPNLNALAERVIARPAVQSALEAEGLKAPVF